jgi:hypothetical protein
MQGLRILANFWQPKLTVGSLVIPEISSGRVARSHFDIELVVDCLARIFDKKTKVWDVIFIIISYLFWSMRYKIRSFHRTSHENPSRRKICFHAARIWCFVGKAVKWQCSLIIRFKQFSLALYYASYMVFELYSCKHNSLIIHVTLKKYKDALVENLYISNYYVAFNFERCPRAPVLMASL